MIYIKDQDHFCDLILHLPKDHFIKYDLDQLQDQDHFLSVKESKVTHYKIWNCLNQSFMHFKERIHTNLTNEGALVPILIKKWNIAFNCLISNRAILIPKYDMKVIFINGDQRSKINCKRWLVLIYHPKDQDQQRWSWRSRSKITDLPQLCIQSTSHRAISAQDYCLADLLVKTR